MPHAGQVSMMMRYTGSAHLGQDLCWCVISIGENAITVNNFRAGSLRYSKQFTEPGQVAQLKGKLRTFYARTKTNGRVLFERQSPCSARLWFYYPSRKWDRGFLRVAWLGLGSL